jgi:hypothetical protein
VIVTAEGLYDDPFDTLQRIRLALADRGWHLRSRRIPADWHRLFTTARQHSDWYVKKSTLAGKSTAGKPVEYRILRIGRKF